MLPGLQDKSASIHAALEADGDMQDLPILVHLMCQQLRSSWIRAQASAQVVRSLSSAPAWHCQQCRTWVSRNYLPPAQPGMQQLFSGHLQAHQCALRQDSHSIPVQE